MNITSAARVAEAATPDELAEASHWVRDVVANPEAVDDNDPAGIVQFIDREYEGGWLSFLDETPRGAA